jgi:uncharacterized protein (TIGR02466 family)
MNITSYNLFTCPIIESSINIDNKKLIKYCHSIKKKEKGRIISNIGGYQSNNLNLKEEQTQTLIVNILQSVLTYANLCGFKNNINYYVDNMWLNINYFKDSNIPHIHPNSLFSGVYYLKVPKNSGSIVFHHPSQNLIDYDWLDYLKFNFNEINSSSWKFTPKEGIIYLFPSWLRHSVESNFNKKEERISIAFNIGVKNNE